MLCSEVVPVSVYSECPDEAFKPSCLPVSSDVKSEFGSVVGLPPYIPDAATTSQFAEAEYMWSGSVPSSEASTEVGPGDPQMTTRPGRWSREGRSP